MIIKNHNQLLYFYLDNNINIIIIIIFRIEYHLILHKIIKKRKSETIDKIRTSTTTKS